MPNTITNPTNFLIRGGDYLARNPDFKLVGREKDLEKLSAILMRRKANSVLLVGAGGVGCTALCMGLQAMKDQPDAPFDIVSKRLFWLDTDALFSSGDTAQINAAFQKILGTLQRTPESILLVEDTKDFIDAARNNNCTHFINALTQAVKADKTQVIFETRDEDLDTVLKCHSDFHESYTMMDLTEPAGDDLLAIVTDAARGLEKHHGIKIAPDAIQTAIELTNKYRTRDMGLSRAQPERSMTLLDRAMTAYRLNAHKSPPELSPLDVQLAAVNLAVREGKIASELQGRTHEELEAMQASLTQDRADLLTTWNATQDEIRRLSKSQRDGEEAIRELENEMEQQRMSEEEARAKGSPEAVAENTPAKGRIRSFASLTAKGGFESDAVRTMQAQIGRFQTEVDKNRTRFEALTESINGKLLLDRDLVLSEFSNISGISASKLNQDEREKLLYLKDNLNRRVLSQEDAVTRLSNAVITARMKKKRKGTKPQASFLFLGPSGVGKTEIAKALSANLLDDEAAITRFDMTEYVEKHAAAKLIGAPPGYEGFEAGGILTNAMRKNPNRILLFDEIEKAHPDVFNIFLQILDDGRLTDNVGRTVNFDGAIILMTSNVGQKHFLDPSLSYEEARERATQDLNEMFRGEFLNRFAGRENIVCFNRLDLPTIETIVKRQIQKGVAEFGEDDLTVEMPDDAVKILCQDNYDPARGARGPVGYIEAHLESAVANALLNAPGITGTMTAGYDADQHKLTVYPPGMKPVTEQNNEPREKVSIAAGFNHA